VIPKHLPKNIVAPWVPISEMVDFQEGPGVRKYQYTETGIKLLNGSNINDNILDLSNTDRYISEEEANGKYRHFLIDPGDLLIASSGIVVEKFHTKIAYANEEHLPLCMNTSTIRFKTKDKKLLDLDYFRRFLATNLFKGQLRRLITGSAQLNFGPSHLKQMYLPLPPLEEQKRIAAILDKADAIRRKRQQAIDLTDQFLHSIFLDMFGDPVMNPKGWNEKLLKSLTRKIGSGATPRGGKSAYVDEGISLIRSLNIHDNKFLHKNLAFITNEQADGLSNVVVEEDDVLLNITGASVCRCAMVDELILPARVNQHVCIIRAKSDLLNPVFLLHYLISDSYKHKLLSVAGAGGATREALTKQQVENLMIAVPPLDMQKQFEEIVNKIQVKSNNEKTSYKYTDAMFVSLTQRAFLGELTKQTEAA